jgi:hypothetical protein
MLGSRLHFGNVDWFNPLAIAHPRISSPERMVAMVMKQDEMPPPTSGEDARGGNIAHRMIYVLGIGLAVVIFALGAVYVFASLG